MVKRERNSFALAVDDLRKELKVSQKKAVRKVPTVQAELNSLDRSNDPIRQTLLRNNIKIRNLQRKL